MQPQETNDLIHVEEKQPQEKPVKDEVQSEAKTDQVSQKSAKYKLKAMQMLENLKKNSVRNIKMSYGIIGNESENEEHTQKWFAEIFKPAKYSHENSTDGAIGWPSV